jgi:hypothetical protein
MKAARPGVMREIRLFVIAHLTLLAIAILGSV